MKKPKIRFKGYQEDWEQRKFADVVDIGSGMDYKHLEEGNIPVYGTGGYLLSVNKALSDDKDAIGIGRKGTIDKPYILRAPFWTVDTLFYCIPKENYDLDFTSCIFQNVDWKKKDESTGVPSLSKVIINNVETATPTMDEQQKIGEYFSNLDHLITLHHRKYMKYADLSVFDWEQRKFGEIVQKYEDPVETPAEGYMRLGIRSHAKGTFHSYVEKGKELETAKMFRVAANNFIVNITFGWEHAVAITDESDAGKLVSHRFPQYSFKEGMNPRFFKYLILDECFRHHLELSSPGGAGRNRVLKLNEMLEYKMKFPQMEEQEEIAIYFEQLDNLITLHQRKCEETKTLKKYMLQKMFPQNGHSVPEIRFSGFTEDWEQRKLGDVFEQTANFVNPNDDDIELWSLTVEDGLTPKSERYNREFLVKKKTNFKEVRPGDIVYNPMNMTLGAVGFNGMAKSVAVSGYYTTMVANKGYDSYYINTWLKSPQAISLYKTFATGSLKEKQRVQFPTLSIIPATFPEHDEQTKIGSYFEHLDHLITLHQHKCEELQNIKKFMLKNMFI